MDEVDRHWQPGEVSETLIVVLQPVPDGFDAFLQIDLVNLAVRRSSFEPAGFPSACLPAEVLNPSPQESRPRSPHGCRRRASLVLEQQLRFAGSSHHNARRAIP